MSVFTPFAFVKQEAAAPTPPAFSFLLDVTSSYSAYSVARRLNSSYLGSAIRVKRSSDSTELDIGFVDNLLDTASLLTFVGAGNGQVTAIYDQNLSGSVAHLNTSSAQPYIVTGGTLLTLDASGSTMPAVHFNGTSEFLTTSPFGISSSYGAFQDSEAIMVMAIPSKPSGNPISWEYGNTGLGGDGPSFNGPGAGTYSRALGNWGTNDQTGAIVSTVSQPTPNRFLGDCKFDYGVTNGSFTWVNGNQDDFTIQTTFPSVNYPWVKALSVGRYPAGGHYERMNLCEFIIYPLLDNGTARTDVRANINTFYGIY